MIQKILKYVLPFTILLGSLLVAFGLSNVNGATIIQTKTINYNGYTWSYKYIDMQLYLQNLENSLNINTIIAMFPSMPELPKTPSNPLDIIDWLNFIGAILFQYIANWLIYALNYILLAPIKIILYPANIIITLLGLNTSDKEYIKILYTVYNFQLPYIPYIE